MDPASPTTVAPATDWSSLLAALIAGRDLTRAEASAAMSEILSGTVDPARIAGLLVGLAAKGETVDELAGMAESMRAAAEPLRIDDRAVDIVGTGGSAHRRLHALNVSTMACFVAAGAGAVVCKHGNRRASSTSGSFDLLEALGVAIDLDGPGLEACVDEVGLGFAFARTFHPAMRFAGPVRAELGVPTAFNLLGPLAHPARLSRQVVGVASSERARLLAEALNRLGSSSAWVVAGHGGLDELSSTGDSEVWQVQGDEVRRRVVRPGELGLEPVPAGALAGGDPARNAELFEAMLAGRGGPIRDIVVLNAAAGLVVADLAPDLAEGVELAAAAIDDGAASAKLEQLRAVTARLSSAR